MITKRTRAKLIAQLAEHGTLATSSASNVITKETVKTPMTVAIAKVMAHNRRATGERWLANSMQQAMLP